MKAINMLAGAIVLFAAVQTAEATNRNNIDLSHPHRIIGTEDQERGKIERHNYSQQAKHQPAGKHQSTEKKGLQKGKKSRHSKKEMTQAHNGKQHQGTPQKNGKGKRRGMQNNRRA